MLVQRLLSLAAAAVLAAAIVWAAVHTPLAVGFAHVVADRWGIVTLVDLYAGFVIVLLIVALMEPVRWVTVLVVLTTPVLGNIVPAIWLAARIRLFVRTHS